MPGRTRQPEATEAPQIRWARRTGLVLLAMSSAASLGVAGVAIRTLEATGWAWRGSCLAAWLLAVAVCQLYWSAYRAWGLAGYGTLLWLAAVGHGLYWDEWPGWFHGLALGLVAGGVVRAERYYWRGTVGEYAALLATLLAVGGAAVTDWWAADENGVPLLAEGTEWGLLGWSALMVITSLIGLVRPMLAISLEPIVWLMYAIRWQGGGEERVPAHGPCLILANHACWMDPFFLEKVLPRPTTPMMTARFYDLPVLRRLMRHFGVIRVPERSFKKEAPELAEAIAALDRGECVLIFPEGYLRRLEECPLRRFASGVWWILRARPNVPVFACWIEGNWGSYTSYWQGPPTKNKRPDWRRPITVAITGPHHLPADLLADQWQTRCHLMNLVASARQLVGLPPLPPVMPATTAALAEKEPSNAPADPED